MLNLKEIDRKVVALRKEHKNQLDISKFLLLRAEVKIQNLRLRQEADQIEKNDESLQEDIVEIKATLKDALHTALKARTKIRLALALLDKAKMSVEASQKRIDINDILNKNKTPDQIKQERQAKQRGAAIVELLRIKHISASCTVYEVIRKAMASYYFDRIGDSLLEKTNNPDNFNLSDFKILVHSYNEHVYIPIEVEDLINEKGHRSHQNSNKDKKETKKP